MKNRNNKPKRKHVPVVVKTVALGAVANVGGQLMKPVADTMVTFIRNKAIYSISIKHDIGRLSQALTKYFDNFPLELDLRMYDDERPIWIKSQRGYRDIDTFDGITMYHGVPIMLSNKMPSSKSERVGRCDDSVASLSTIRNERCIRVLHEFIEELYHDMRMIAVMKHIEHLHQWRIVNGLNAIALHNATRTFADVFIPSTDRKMLEDTVGAYVSNREFYETNNLPNHFGILLHGAPGTGKGSLAQAIAEYAHADLYVMTGDQIRYLPDIIDRTVCHVPITPDIYRVLLIEDIDSGIFSLNRDNWESSKRNNDYMEDESDDEFSTNSMKGSIGIATILNAIDGIGSATNIIYIFTTNHIEMLDPALIRPGRMDVCLEVGYVCAETLQMFLEKHFPSEDIPVIEHVRDGISFADLQTKLLIGYTPIDIIEYCK